ncbi:MAG: hypothetical protein GY854_30170 [Deltaproteobacteria bacterium]|nr:hypothetical protein [Deltaproteobacteria bacterium]
MNNPTKQIALLGVLFAFWCLGLAACSDDDTRGWNTVVDGGAGDADGDSDSDADGDPGLCSSIEWGVGCQKDKVVGNWQLTGFADTDGDHLVEQVSTTISLEDIHCSGAESLIVGVGDTS